MILLETLPGWPEAPATSSVEMLMLMLIGPLIAAAFITALVFAPKLLKQGRSVEKYEA